MFFEYGDDSVAQLGGVHLACEQASNLLTKVLEWGRLMSYLEQSTRYIAYDARLGGRYRYYRDPDVLGSPLGTRYVGDMDRLFDTYAELRAGHAGVVPATQYPKDAERLATSSTASRSRPRRSTPCGACCRRRRSPTSASTAPARPTRRCCCACGPTRCPRPGAYADLMLTELRKVIPSFLKRVDLPDRGGRGPTTWPRTGRPWRTWPASCSADGDEAEPAPAVTPRRLRSRRRGQAARGHALPVHRPARAPDRATGSGRCRPTSALAVVRAYVGERTNRRHKPGRALERADYRFDVLRRLRRLPRPAAPPHAHHRVAALTPRHGYALPEAVDEAGVADRFDEAMERSAGAARRRSPTASRTQAAYAVCLAYRVRYVMQLNAREAMHLHRAAHRPAGPPRVPPGGPGDAPADRRAGRPPGRRRDDALRRPRPRARARAARRRAAGRPPPRRRRPELSPGEQGKADNPSNITTNISLLSHRATFGTVPASGWRPQEVVVIRVPRSFPNRHRCRAARWPRPRRDGSRTIRQGETLSGIASRHGVSMRAIVDANGIRDPDLIIAGRSLEIPGASGAGSGGTTSYVVERGDTLAGIATKFGTTIKAIVSTNGIANPNLIIAGRTLKIPGSGGSAGPQPVQGGGGSTGQPGAGHLVKPGESVGSIAADHGISSADLSKWNGIIDGRIYAGTRLLFYSPGSLPGSGGGGGGGTHVVSGGETLAAMPARYGTSVRQIAGANGITNPDLIRVGQRLTIPGGSGVVCPVSGATFFNDWGFPRSGGRYHSGNDLFAPRGTPVLAPVRGAVTQSTGTIGGHQVRLVDGSGNLWFSATSTGSARQARSRRVT